MKKQITILLITSINLSFCILQTAFAQTLTVTLTTSNHNSYNLSCAGSRDGTINSSVTGGTPPYTYTWSNAAATQNLSGLAAGYYGLDVKDQNGDHARAEVTLTEPQSLRCTPNIYEYPNGYNISLYNAYNGSITLTITGGVTNYSYNWDDGSTTQNRTSLGAGTYIVTVTDANGCSVRSEQINLRQPDRSDWRMDGNSGSNPSTNFIGTTDNKDFVIKTNNIERFRIKANGSLTLNNNTNFEKIYAKRITAYPDTMLYIGDSTIIFNYTYNQITGDASGTKYKGLGLGPGTEAVGLNSLCTGYLSITRGNYSCAMGDWVATGTNATNAIVLGSGMPSSSTSLNNDYPNTFMLGFNSNIPTLVVSSSNGTYTIGKVGIGVDNPNNLRGTLDLKGTFVQGLNFAGNTSVTPPSNGALFEGSVGIGTATPNSTAKLHVQKNGDCFLRITSINTTKAQLITESNGNVFAFGIDNSGGHIYCNTGTDATTQIINILPTGEVGIGIDPATQTYTTAHYKLLVGGKVGMNEAWVSLGSPWPDYVFNDEYRLLPLQELEKFIKANKHLPEFSSSDEINKLDKINIGAMQLKQQEKIEELFLYIFQLKKEIELLKEPNKN